MGKHNEPRTHCWRCGGKFGGVNAACQRKHEDDGVCTKCSGKNAYRKTDADYRNDMEPGECGHWRVPIRDRDEAGPNRYFRGHCDCLRNSSALYTQCVSPNNKDNCPIARMFHTAYLYDEFTGGIEVRTWHGNDIAKHG